MDDSFGAAMAGLVIEDASRMSGARFADVRGTGVARRVRTRRRVRAAGMGGASAVAVGAIAVGASHVPWGAFEAAPGIGVTDCATRSASEDAYVYEVVIRQGVTPVDTVALNDAATGATFLTATLQPDATYVFADADGNPLRSAAGELPGYYWITGPQIPPNGGGAAIPGAADIQVKSASTADFGGLPSAVASALDDCYTPSPTSTGEATASADASSSPDPSLAAKPEDVTSPFQCGFAFDTESSDAPHLTVTATAWNTPRGGEIAGDNDVDPSWSAVASDQGVSAVHGVVRATVGSDQLGYDSLARTLANGMDPADPAGTTNAADSAIVGASFVDVRDGVVVGTMSIAGSDATRAEGAILNDHQFASTLLTPQAAFKACPDAAPSDGSVDVYFVAGALVTGSQGSDVTAGPEYAWAWIGTFSSNGSSISAPTN